MSIVVNTNVSSIAASRAVYETREDMELAMERLSSGKRINSSRDDAAGQTVVSRMRAQISSLNQAVRNANDGISMVNTYDGAADEIEDILVRMRELATLAQNGTYVSNDLTNANLEYQALKSEIDRISSKTMWNGTKAVADSAVAVSFQVGFGGGDNIGITFSKLEASALYGAAPGTISTAASAAAEVTVIDTALNALNSGRAVAGATINRRARNSATRVKRIQGCINNGDLCGCTRCSADRTGSRTIQGRSL